MSLFEVIHMIESLGIKSAVIVFRTVPNGAFKVLPLTDDNDVLNMVSELPRNHNVHLDYESETDPNDETVGSYTESETKCESGFEEDDFSVDEKDDSETESVVHTPQFTEHSTQFETHFEEARVVSDNETEYSDSLHSVDESDSEHSCRKKEGLKEALAEYFPYSEHRFCVRHLYNNFKGKHKGKALKDSFWKAATSTYMREFQVALAEMKSLSPKAFEWLKNVDPKFWSKSHFSTRSNCDMLLNNLCESFNKCVLEARSRPIITMLEGTRTKIMQRIAKKKVEADKWTGVLCPKIQKKLEAATEMSNRATNGHHGRRCLRRRPPPFDDNFDMQDHQRNRLDVLFLLLGSEFEDGHWNSRKMASKPLASAHRISSVHRWMAVISRYVAPMTTI
ncbi:hypothetical protein GQ457_04G026090 [Hibiscus cannabinus]